MESIKISDLVTGLSESMQNAQNAIQDVTLQGFMRYFEEAQDENDGSLQAKSKNLKVRYSENGIEKTGKISVPLASLVQHSHMCLDNIDLTLYAHLEYENGELYAKLVSDEKKGLFDKESRGRKEPGLCTLKLAFKNEEASEGIQNITGMFSRNI